MFPDLACIRRRRGELQVGFILLPGASLLAAGFEGHGEVVMGDGLIGLALDGLLVLLDGSVKVPCF